MEYSKDEIFQIRYNTNLDRLQIGGKRWTKRLLQTIKRHKLMTVTVIAFIIFSILNVAMIFTFINILQNF